MQGRPPEGAVHSRKSIGSIQANKKSSKRDILRICADFFHVNPQNKAF
jgi:hypothetical protein